jgi:plastocyanin
MMVAIVGLGLAMGSALAQPALASGGGGCGRPVSDAHGTRVRIKAFCFTPTVIHIRRGQKVTFENLDPWAHNVQGASVSWGSWNELTFGKPVTYRFVRAGVYPYLCSLHPGMLGAVVVGNGNGSGGADRTTTQRGPVIRLQPARVQLTRASFDDTSGNDSLPWPIVAFVGLGLFAVAGLALAQLRQQIKSH